MQVFEFESSLFGHSDVFFFQSFYGHWIQGRGIWNRKFSNYKEKRSQFTDRLGRNDQGFAKKEQDANPIIPRDKIPEWPTHPPCRRQLHLISILIFFLGLFFYFLA